MPLRVPKPERADPDGKAWRDFAADVRPLSAGALREPRPVPAVATPEEKARPGPGSQPARGLGTRRMSARRPEHLAGLVVGRAPAGLDNATWRRLSNGMLRPAATLDLHGMTATGAVSALEEFLHHAADAGHRTVEIITGRGQGPEGGIIRREFPHWLNAPALRPLLLGACHPHRANPGSVLLLLRRKR